MADAAKTAGPRTPAKEPESIHSVLVRVMLGRLVLLGALLAGLSALAAGRSLGLYAVIAVAFLVTIPYAAWLRNVDTMRQSAENQFLLDVLIITGIIHFTGGIDSDLCLLYPLVILAAGIVISGDLAFRVALFAVLVYATLTVLEIGGVLPFPPGSRVPEATPQAAIQTLMMRVLFFLFFAAAASFISDRVLVQDRELRRLRGVGQILFNEVSVPLLAYLPETRRVVLANEAAANLLGAAAESLHDSNIDAFFGEAIPDPASAPAPTPNIWEMRRCDGTSFPALVEISNSRLPSSLASTFTEATGVEELAVLAFHDVSELLGENETARLRRTAGILAELAHSVGNPVAALRGAGDVLAKTARLLARGGKVTVQDLALIQSMCGVIGDEARKLDDKVAFFLELAGSNPERLRELAEQAEFWADKLALGPERGQEAASPPLEVRKAEG
ncbi:MAG: hypothetical protein GXP31_12880 [Kiritimatiellaeota bacterium]|nr:hypothetical protein [Kiritimatiellota bacterium]